MTAHGCAPVMSRWLLVAVVAAGCLAGLGCQTTPGLMAVPNVYALRGDNPFDETPLAQRVNPVPVLYATDRAAAPLADGRVAYTAHRAPSLAVGVAAVTFGAEDLPWETLVAQSLASRRTESVAPSVLGYTEHTRYPTGAMYIEAFEGRPDQQAALEAEVAVADRVLHRLVAEALRGSQSKTAHVFVHGYNVRFDEAVTTIAQIWHFLGRDGLPVAYSWPAGRGGVRGYTVDRESGEFTVTHLKRFIESLARSPEVEKINLIAHSRGTDVTATALRELFLQYGRDPARMQRELKLNEVILAAPDLDVDVVNQRLAAEGVLQAPRRLTVYISERDRAVSLAGWVFESTLRLGTLPIALLTPGELRVIEGIPAFELINTQVKRVDPFGHSYFYQSPAVSSDVIMLLRHNAPPGSPRRPLEPLGHNLWLLRDGYPG